MGRDGSVVLVVDDDRANRLTLTALLEGEGYAVRAVADGEEALAALAADPYDAVLLDLLMPGVGGMDVLADLKADGRLWRIPVLVISAVEDTASIVRCLELGAEDYVSKPFDPVVLRARINAALARRRFTDLEAEYHKLVEEQATELAELRARLEACTCGAAAAGDGDER
jgi:adenylate cyclase